MASPNGVASGDVTQTTATLWARSGDFDASEGDVIPSPTYKT